MGRFASVPICRSLTASVGKRVLLATWDNFWQRGIVSSMPFKLRAPPPSSQVLRGPSLSQGVFQAPRKAPFAAEEQLMANMALFGSLGQYLCWEDCGKSGRDHKEGRSLLTGVCK